jgi:hypothetical protein
MITDGDDELQISGKNGEFVRQITVGTACLGIGKG